MTTTESKNVRFAIATSVAVHVLVLLVLAWLMGLGQSARLLVKQQMALHEVPKVTMIFPDQILPVKPAKLKLNPRQYIRTSQNAPADEKPVKSDFISDRNTKAASNVAPFPDGDKAMPSSRGEARPTMELKDRDAHDGKIASDNGGKPEAPAPAAPAKPKLEPLPPTEPITLPSPPKKVEVAKIAPPDMKQLLEDLDKDSNRIDVTKLPLQVKKAESAPKDPPKQEPKPKTAATPPPTPAADAKPKMRTMEDFSPMTRKAAVKGTISNKGESAVDAEATPMGQFMRLVTSAVEKKWHELQLKNAADVSYGYLRVRFYVNRAGHVEQPEFLEKSSNPLMDDFTLDAILSAELPPIPKDLLPLLEDERVPVEYSIIIND